jgi:hypothetical protein
VGSIGVVTSHVDFSKAMDAEGVKVTFIHAGKHKVDGNPYEPLSADVKSRIQSEINALYDIFVATVARNRGIGEQAIRDTEAQTYLAAEALSNGLADKIGAFNDSVAAYAAFLNNQPGETQMSTKKDDTAAADQATLEAAATQARESGHKEGFAAGVTAERSRIASIMKLDEAANRKEAAFNIAVSTDMSVEQSKALLSTLPESKPEGKQAAGALFEAAMTATDNPDLGGNAPAQEPNAAAQILADDRFQRSTLRHL